MENMELLQAMRQMMEEVVSPIYERMDKMQEELPKRRLRWRMTLCPKSNYCLRDTRFCTAVQRNLTKWRESCVKSNLMFCC